MNDLSVSDLWLGEGSPPNHKPVPPATGGPPQAVENKLRVLLVDDEELIRRLAMSIARRVHIDLLAVATAPAALELARASHIDVLVADVLLGEGVDGIDLARQIALLQPRLSVVLMSGYNAAQFDLSELSGDTQFLTKPFSTESFLRCLTATREHTATAGQ
jgi:CheY-like chemotaxis protein